MIALKKFLCKNCNKLVTCEFCTDFTVIPIFGERVVFSETYGICDICKGKIVIPDDPDTTWREFGK